METWRAEDVVLFPHRAKIETELIVTLDTQGMADDFNITIEGDHLPDGTDGYKEYFVGAMDLTVDEARELYDELGQWLNEHGSP